MANGDFLHRLCSAIATQEGYFAETPTQAKRNNNPGNLRAAPWLSPPPPVTKSNGAGFVIFVSPAAGIAGIYHQVALDVARGATLRALISKWAPPTENATQVYIATVAAKLGLTAAEVVGTPLQEFLKLEKL